jgi:hypothetical protein
VIVRALLLALLPWAWPGSLAPAEEPAVEAAQEPPSQSEGTVQLEVRVGSAERGWALVDRGSNDGLRVGDTVVFLPREGGTFTGTVSELEERAARVELADRDFVPAAGTRGRVQLPRARMGAVARPRLRPAPKRELPEGTPPPTFENQDSEWHEGEPLLARIRPVRPWERAPGVRGRSYAILDHTQASEDDRHDTFARAGGELLIDNPFGRGDRIHADAEWNWRKVDVPDLDDEEDVELRVDRLSYAWGNTRFTSEGWEVGRFLQSGMSEFGVLDGAEWTARDADGNRYGASLGYMPEPDQEFQTGEDLQLAGFYRWVADESEELSAAAGYQKTFHNGAADRDLVIANLARLPSDGWSFFGTLWIDVYTEGDDEKGTLLGLTQAYLSTGRRWAGGSSLDLVYSHLEFPEIDRNEFLPVEDAQLADDHNERLALTSGVQLTRETRLLTGLGGWIDEDDEGGDAELGFAFRDFLFERAFMEVLGFATRGSTVTELGARFSAGRYVSDGRWALDYEFSQNRLDGFSSDNDDLPQHRLRFSRDHAWGAWDLSWRVEGLLYDDENALTLGLYLQRRHD